MLLELSCFSMIEEGKKKSFKKKKKKVPGVLQSLLQINFFPLTERSNLIACLQMFIEILEVIYHQGGQLE